MYIIYIYIHIKEDQPWKIERVTEKKKKKMNYCRAEQRKVERKYKESKEDMWTML